MHIYWMRRDLRLEDNPALTAALESGQQVMILFVFDPKILGSLESDDSRVSFIWRQLESMNQELASWGARIKVYHQEVSKVWEELVSSHSVEAVYWNRDYEPAARERDAWVFNFLKSQEIPVSSFQDHVVFEPGQVLKADGTPYTVYTPFKKRWLAAFYDKGLHQSFQPLETRAKLKRNSQQLQSPEYELPSLESMGFTPSKIQVEDFDLKRIQGYSTGRDFPAQGGTSDLSPHLRFGTIGYRSLVQSVLQSKAPSADQEIFLSELVWREFFMHILFHFPDSSHRNFKAKYDSVRWRLHWDSKLASWDLDPQEKGLPQDEALARSDFQAWREGKTGYPMVDAGMRQLNQTGYMHNRVRMVVASFLVKHLMIDWKLGERYFASKLLDYELASNAGNWQWAAGTGCDAAPYFRVFNPITQFKKFDPRAEYVKQWVPEYCELDYSQPVVEHTFARQRCLETYKLGLSEHQ